MGATESFTLWRVSNTWHLQLEQARPRDVKCLGLWYALLNKFTGNPSFAGHLKRKSMREGYCNDTVLVFSLLLAFVFGPSRGHALRGRLPNPSYPQ